MPFLTKRRVLGASTNGGSGSSSSGTLTGSRVQGGGGGNLTNAKKSKKNTNEEESEPEPMLVEPAEEVEQENNAQSRSKSRSVFDDDDSDVELFCADGSSQLSPVIPGPAPKRGSKANKTPRPGPKSSKSNAPAPRNADANKSGQRQRRTSSDGADINRRRRTPTPVPIPIEESPSPESISSTRSRSLLQDPTFKSESESSAVSNFSHRTSFSNQSRCTANDKDWTDFRDLVQKSPESAPTHLANDLYAAGTNCSTFLGKLIYRSVSEQSSLNDNSTTTQTQAMVDKYEATILRAVLRMTLHHDNTSQIVVDVVNMTFTELRHFTTPVLYSIVGSCLEYLKDDKDREGSLPARWIEVFGKLVAIMVGRGDIKHETDIIDGKAYREYVITEICRLKWDTESTASLIAVLREIPGIEESDLKIILHQVRSCIKNFKACVIPPVVHQLILLAGTQCPLELLSICEEYFNNVDFADTSSLIVRQKRNALGTVVFHFLEGARHSDALLKAVIKIVKASFFDFRQVMNPFNLSIVLGLTTYDHAKTVVIEPLRNSIMKYFHSMHLSRMSYWYNKTAGESEDKVTPCFKAILESTSSKSELEFMIDGLRELGIGLLNADIYQHKYPNTVKECQALGTYLITSLVKKYEEQLGIMMNHLVKVSYKSTAHTQCLATCLQMRTRQIIHPSVIGKSCEIIRSLPMMESNSAALIVKAMSNALQLSYTLLDQLLINLRKTIWKSVEARRTAAKIMIILLSNSRVVGDVPFSQYSESQRLNSQNGNGSSYRLNGQLPDNQPLCLELVTLTKRCFSQQCEIREELYLGFHTVIRRNPELCELICSQLITHGSQYLNDGDDFVLDKVIELPPASVTLGGGIKIKEEVGFLVQCLTFVVLRSHQAFHHVESGPPAAVDQLEGLIGRWEKAVLSATTDTCSCIAAQIVSDAGGSRPLDVVHYVEIALTIQLMQVVEALLEFLTLDNRQGSDRRVKKLFTMYQTLEPTLKKEKEKPKRGNGDKTKGDKTKNKDTSNDDTSSIADTASEASENPAVRFKRPDAPKRLVYKHIMNSESVLDALTKLNKADPEEGALSRVQQDEDYEKFLLGIVKQKLGNFKRNEPLHERNRQSEKIAEIFADIAGVMWTGLLARNAEDEVSADVTANSEMVEMRLEVINEIVDHLCTSHSSVCCRLIKSFGDEDADVLYNDAFPKFFNSWKAVHAWMPVNSEGSETAHSLLFDILKSFSNELSPDTRQTTHASEVLNWIWAYMSSSSGKKKAEFILAESITSCWLSYNGKARGFLEQPGESQHDVSTLAKAVHYCLGNIEEMQNSTANIPRIRMWLINEDTASTVLCSIMNFIETILIEMTTLLTKLKGHQPSVSNEGILTNRKPVEIREGCFSMVNQILDVCTELVSSAFPAGLSSSTMLKVIPQIFTLMAGFGEYFLELSRSKQDYSIKGFSVPVTSIGNNFKCVVESMIAHIEKVQREFAEELLQQKQTTNKKSKSTNCKIPNAVKNQLTKDKKLIPHLVYSIEKYDQVIFTLSNKIKDKNGARLLVGMKLSTSRDYKINAGLFSEALENRLRARSAQDITAIPEDETRVPTAGPSKPKSAQRVRKGKKRKNEDEEEGGENNDE